MKLSKSIAIITQTRKNHSVRFGHLHTRKNHSVRFGHLHTRKNYLVRF